MVLEYVLLGAALYLLLLFLGLPLWLTLFRGNDRFPVALLAPLAGMAVLETFAYYWWQNTSSGLSTGLPILVGVVAVITIPLLVRHRVSLRPTRAHLPAIGTTLLLAVAVTAVVAVHYQQAVDVGRPTVASVGNNDPASYTIVSEGLRDHGFEVRGNIFGSHIGSIGEHDTTGTFAVLAAAGEVTDRGVWEVALSTMGVAVLLIALACAQVARLIFPGSMLRSAAIGGLAVLPYLFVYNMAHYFLAQMLSIAPLIALLLVYATAANATRRSDILRGAARALVLLVPVVLMYPHMALLAQPILLGAVFVGPGLPGLRDLRALVVRGVRLGIVAVAGLGGAALLVLPAVGNAIDRAQALADVDAGWPLSLFSPFETLGLQRFPTGFNLAKLGPSLARYLVELAVVFALAAGALLVLRGEDRARARLGAACVVLVLVSYRFAYLQQGYSYRQWKWISFFQPLLVTAFVAIVAAGAVAVARRWSLTSKTVLRVAGVTAGLIAAVVLTIDARTFTKRPQQWQVVQKDLSGVEQIADSRLRAVNVNLAPYWESMWAAYFVDPKLAYLMTTTYFGYTTPTAPWTLEYSFEKRAPGSRVRRLNDSYVLVCAVDPPCPTPFESHSSR